MCLIWLRNKTYFDTHPKESYVLLLSDRQTEQTKGGGWGPLTYGASSLTQTQPPPPPNKREG